MIRIIDYGVGNIQAFLNLFKRLGMECGRANTSEELQDSSHLILPGVGCFDNAMNSLNESGLRPELERLVLEESKPILGVCVGMHMLAETSDEGKLPGLGWIPGKVRSFNSMSSSDKLLMPHMGWNTLNIKSNSCLFKIGFDNAPQFYFLHSYYFDADDRNDVDATAFYGAYFDVTLSRRNIYGMQCHPEKSHSWGVQLLKNFVEFS